MLIKITCNNENLHSIWYEFPSMIIRTALDEGDEVWFMQYNLPAMMTVGQIRTLHRRAPWPKIGLLKEEHYATLPYNEEIGWLRRCELFRSEEKLLKSLLR